MSILIFVLVAAFVLANAWVEVINEGPRIRWSRRTLSDYMAGLPGSRLMCLTYIGLVAAEVLVIFIHPRSLPEKVCLVAASAGLLGVVVTANVMIYARAPVWVSALHYVLAGFAFAGALASEALILWPAPEVGFVAGGLATVLAFFLLAPTRKALSEKALTGWLLAGLLAIAARSL